MQSKNKLNILMITGVYLPEINGAVLQCSQLINNLKDSINYSVLTGTSSESCGGQVDVEGICVTKIYINRSNKFKYVVGIVNFYISLIKILKNIDLIHIHGFSNRNAITILICIIFKKKVIIKMTSYGYDDPMSIKKSSFLSWMIFKYCHAYIGISPAFSKSYEKTGQLESKYSLIPNGVDLIRYNKINANNRNILRLKYGFSARDLIVIFVGHFSPEKRPILLYKAWVNLLEKENCAKLIFIGRTVDYFEVDEEIIDQIKLDALERGILHLIHFVEETHHVDEYMKIADVFVLPSMREGLPNVLLEAMACALPCIVSDLPGVTDWLIEDGKTGEILRSDVPEVLTEKLMSFVADPDQLISIGWAARQVMERNFSSTATSQAVLDLYRKIIKPTSNAG